MIDRYSCKEIEEIWNRESKFGYYLDVEKAVCEAYYKLGCIPQKSFENIKTNSKFSLRRIDEIEQEVKHDVIAFLTSVNESLGEDAKYIHVGLTSSDVIDTAFAIQIKNSSEIVLNNLELLTEKLLKMAFQYKNTICIGRSHGVHAEIMTFGFKLLNWYDTFERAKKGLKNALDEVSTGQISGPVGTYSNINPEIEKMTCEILGLKPARISTQVISRDRHAKLMSSLAIISTLIEEYAIEIRNLSRTEIAEVQEGFAKEQKGSSAMPHKKNPVLCENLCGLARVIKSNMMVAFENISLWHERDISHSSAERIIFPDTFNLVTFMLKRFNNVLENLVINENNMLRNSQMHGGIVFSQKVLLKLTEKGLTRENAYKIVQKHALSALENNNFKQNLKNDTEVTKILSEQELENCFDVNDYLKNIDEIFARF